MFSSLQARFPPILMTWDQVQTISIQASQGRLLEGGAIWGQLSKMSRTFPGKWAGTMGTVAECVAEAQMCKGEGAQQPASWQVLKNQVLELPSAGWGVQEVRGGDPSHFLSALFWGRQRRKGIDPRQKGTSGQEVRKLWEGGRKETWTLQKPFRRSVHTVESRKARSPVPDPGNWPPVACKWQGAFCYLERRMKPVVRTASGSAGRLAVCERFWGITYVISWSPRGSPVRFITILQKWNLKTRKIRETEKCPR